MYITKITPRLTRESFKLFSDSYQIHRTVMSGFPSDVGRKDNSILFFIDNESVLIQSQVKPNWTDKPFDSQCKEFVIDFQKGQQLNFKLRANPVVRSNKKVYPIKEEQKLVEWLQKQGQKHGFSIDFVSVSKNEVLSFSGKTGEQTHNSVMFSGKLTVENIELFKSSVENGIGRGKAFGLGLLMTAK